ncbi:AAA family ATPase [Pseudomonas sp. NPDC078700]|uniref:AAA family ATPase n=1 Tax=Pseudomonas sp. NPDC078700 TaxID=3364424 RepID=UPI0037C9EA7D
MLIVFSGLPGTGKTTIASMLAQQTGALYLRIDTIEQTLRNSGVLAGEVGASGYKVANELAQSNLRFGTTVIADCVNPVAENRMEWANTAASAEAQLVNIEVICSNKSEHQRRVESRSSSIAGLTPPTWQSVMQHDYQAWDSAPFTIDTALITPEQAVNMIISHINSKH